MNLRNSLIEVINYLSATYNIVSETAEDDIDAKKFYAEKIRQYIKKDPVQLLFATVNLAIFYCDQAWKNEYNPDLIKVNSLMQFAKNCLSSLDDDCVLIIKKQLDQVSATCVYFIYNWEKRHIQQSDEVVQEWLDAFNDDDKSNKEKLLKIRQKFSTQIEELIEPSINDLFQIYQNCFVGVKNLLSDIFSQSLRHMDEVPCEYAYVISGSHARLLGTPWSDIESFLIIQDQKYQAFFLERMKIFICKIYNFGETILPAYGLNHLQVGQVFDDYAKNGFAFDWDGVGQKTPFGTRKNGKIIYRLTGSIDYLFNLTLNMKNNDQDYLIQILSTTKLICGDKYLYWQFKNKFFIKKENNFFIRKFRMETENAIKEIYSLEKNKNADKKNQYYRPISMLIENLYNLHGQQDESSPYIKIMWLYAHNIIDKDQKNILSSCLTQVLHMRARQAIYFSEQKTEINESFPGFKSLLASLSSLKQVLTNFIEKFNAYDRKMLFNEHRFFVARQKIFNKSEEKENFINEKLISPHFLRPGKNFSA